MRYTGRLEREEPAADGEEKDYNDFEPHQRQPVEGEDDSPTIHHCVQRAILLTWESETSTASTHLSPPQEQPPASAGKTHSND